VRALLSRTTLTAWVHPLAPSRDSEAGHLSLLCHSNHPVLVDLSLACTDYLILYRCVKPEAIVRTFFTLFPCVCRLCASKLYRIKTCLSKTLSKVLTCACIGQCPLSPSILFDAGVLRAVTPLYATTCSGVQKERQLERNRGIFERNRSKKSFKSCKDGRHRYLR